MSIAFVNNEIAGGFEPFPKPMTRQVNKKFDSTAGTDKEWIRGYLYAKDPDETTTQAEYVVAEADSVKQFCVSVDTRRKALSGIPNNYIWNDGDFSLLGALQSDPLTLALFSGIVCMYIDGVVNPGEQVMPSNGAGQNVLGHVMRWDDNNERQVVGTYLARIGQSGGKWIRTSTPDAIGTLAKVWVEGGA